MDQSLMILLLLLFSSGGCGSLRVQYSYRSNEGESSHHTHGSTAPRPAHYVFMICVITLRLDMYYDRMFCMKTPGGARGLGCKTMWGSPW